MSMKNLLLILGLLSLGPHIVRADSPCQPENNDIAYPKGIAAAIQKFAPKVTKTGNFVIKDEFPGEGHFIVISFVDGGKTLFTHTTRNFELATATEIKAGKTKDGDPGFSVALVQGHLGECRYNVLFRDAKFVVIDKGFKPYRSR